MFGCTQEEILGQRPEDVSPRVQPDGRESAVKAADRIAAALDGTPQRFEWQHTRMDGTPFHTEVSLNSVQLPSGQYIQAIVRDMTERKRADEILRESQAILNETGMIARIGGWKHDLATGKATWTQALYDILEIEPDHGVPEVDEHLSYYLTEDRRRLEEAYRKAIESGEPFDLDLQTHTAKGRPLWCRVLGRPVMHDGTCVEMRGTFQDITEYKKARAEIEGLARFPSENPWPVMRIDSSGTILYANPASSSPLTELDTGVGRCAPQSWCEAVGRVHASGSAEHLEMDFRSATLAFQIVPVPNAPHVNVYGTDITRHKRAEEELRRERDRSQKYLDVAGVMFIALDPSGRVSLVNRKGCEILGYDEREILGMDWFANFVPEHMRRNVWDIFDKLMRGQTNLAEYAETPVVIRGRSERVIAWHNTVLTDDTGTIVGTLSSGEDVTERKRAEETLRMFQFSVDQSPDAVFWLRRDGGFRYVNDKACESLGYSREELLNLRVWDIDPYFPKERLDEEWKQYQKNEIGTQYMEAAHCRKDGAMFPIDVSVRHFWFGDTEFHVAFVRDITERKQAEQKLHEQQENEKQRIEAELTRVRDELVRKTRLAALGQVSGSIAHDLRNPLGAVRNASYLLKLPSARGKVGPPRSRHDHRAGSDQGRPDYHEPLEHHACPVAKQGAH